MAEQQATGWAPAPEAQAAPSGWAPAPEQAAAPPPGPVGPSTAGDPFHPAHAAVRSGPYARAAAATAPPGATTRSRTGQLYDPSRGGISPETGRMLGGMAGAAAATALVPEVAGPAWLVRGAQALTPVVGAALGGGATAAAQGTSPLEGATEQGLLEAGGQAVAWPLKAVGRRLLAHPVAKAAAEHLGQARSMVNQQLDTILSQAEGAVRATREGVANAVGRAREAVRGAKAAVGTAEEAAASQTAQRAAQWPPAAGAPERYAQTGRDVVATIQGPAKHSLDQLGQAVTDAAKTGPDVDMRPIKAKLESMASAARPSTQGGVPTPGSEYVKAAGGGRGADKIAAALKEAGIPLEDTHPLPGVLRQLQDAPDTLSFEDAHKIKRLLDEATNWSSPAKKQLQGITKGIRSELRTVMSSHEPYNTATEAYRAAVPLFTKGVAKQITRSVEEHPEGIVKLIRGDQPTKLQMLKDVLTHHATAGGGAEQGQAAWNGVRSAWTYEHLIKGGIEKFEGNLGKLHPDFLETMYGDADGKVVLDNLKAISQAFRQAKAQGEAAVGAAKAGVTAASDTAARTAETGRAAVAKKATEAGATRTQVAEAKKPTAVEQAFQKSSLASAPPPSQVAGDVLHTVASHGGNVFRARSVGRLVLGGPKVNDLVQWASFSPKRTQLLVRAVTSPAPGMAMADLMRAAGIAGEEHDTPRPMPSHAPTGAAAAPPPR